jgi:hypothetical protein
MSITIQELRELIQKTHVHGLQLRRELIALDKADKAKSIQARTKRALLKGLEALNHRRRVELAQREHPTPPPKPQRFTMYDTTDATRPFPTSNPTAVAGYAGGKWPTYAGLVAKYPRAKHLSIAVNAGERARCLDIETGDASPAQAPNWFHTFADHSQGKPIFYGDEEKMVAFEEALRDAGIHRWEYLVWKAHYAGTGPRIDPGSDATQYESVETGGFNYDASLCESWFL